MAAAQRFAARSNYRLPSSAAFDSALHDQMVLLKWIHATMRRLRALHE